MAGWRRAERIRARVEHAADKHLAGLGMWAYRRTGGRIVHLWHRRALILTTRGRRSGRPHSVLLQFFADGEDLVVAAAGSGLPGRTDWYLNLKAHPQAEAEVEGRTLHVRAEEMPPADAAAFWPRVLAIAPDYARYPRRAGHAIPLLRLVPAHDSHHAT